MHAFRGHLTSALDALQGFPELDRPLGDLEGATDWQEAAASGRVTPTQVSLSSNAVCMSIHCTISCSVRGCTSL